MSTEIESLKYPIGKYSRADKYNPETVIESSAVLKVLPTWLDMSIENLDAYQLQTPYRDGGWTVQQLVHHIADSHMNAYIRLKLALTEENPEIKPYDEKLWAELADSSMVSVNMSTIIVHGIHARMVAIMESMSPEDWERTFYHREHKRYIPVWELANLYAWHSKHHIAHIRNLRERMGW